MRRIEKPWPQVQGLSIHLPSHRANERQGREGVCYETPERIRYEFMAGAASNQADREIAQRGKILRRLPRSDSAGVFAHAHVAYIMQSVFDGPMLAREFQQLFCIGARPRQTRDRQNDFRRRLAVDRPGACDSTNLLNARPRKPRRNGCQRFDRSCFEPVVAFVTRSDFLQILLPRHSFLRGKQALGTHPTSLV